MKGVSDQVAKADLPQTFQPIFSYDGWYPGLGHVRGAMHVPETGQPTGMCILLESEVTDEATLRTAIDDAIKKSGKEENKNITFQPVKTVSRTVNDKPAEFTLSQATDGKGKGGWLVHGQFKTKSGKNGTMVLVVDGSQNEEDVEEIINSVE